VAHPAATERLGTRRAAVAFARLKWHVLRGGLRGSTQQRITTLVSVVVSLLFGVLGAMMLAAIGRVSTSADAVLVVLLPAIVLGLGIVSAATGVETSIDPRHLAAEPITPWELGVGMLAGAAIGPGALLAVVAASGLVIGWGGGGPAGWSVTTAALLLWWLTLLLVSRTTANLLGAVAAGRFRWLAQFVAAASAVVIWVGVQVATRFTAGWDAGRWEAAAGVAAWTPPGQLGRALGAVDRPLQAMVHLALASAWLPLLAWSSVRSTSRLALAPPRAGAGPARVSSGPGGLRAGPRRWLPSGPVGAVAVRTLTTKVRTPRQSVNTITALLVGAGVLLIGPVLDGGIPDPRFVMIGGMLQFAVLFDGNNAYGMDGPAIWLEVTSGADAVVLTLGKVLSSLTVMVVPTAALPVVLAALSGGWVWLPAALLIGAGSLAAAAGVSVVGASLAPVALPDSPNPLAAGDTGQGCIAGLMLGASMLVLLVVSTPVAVLVAVASSRSVLAATAAALTAPAVGGAVLWAGVVLSRWRLAGREAELVELVTPAR
jgi:ABC-2 type transport system permease protein